jgi:GNAT superfamily N-acetyltransferase
VPRQPIETSSMPAAANPPVQVRDADEADARGIAEVHVRAWQRAYRGLVDDRMLDGLSLEAAERNWQRLVTERGSTTLVAVRERRVEGFCAIATPARDDDATEATAEVAAIYVAPESWRTGVGNALLEVALEGLREEGWDEVTLWVFAANDQARSFYTHHGFEPDGAERRNETVGRREVRLRKAVAAAD